MRTKPPREHSAKQKWGLRPRRKSGERQAVMALAVHTSRGLRVPPGLSSRWHSGGSVPTPAPSRLAWLSQEEVSDAQMCQEERGP